MDGVRLTPVTDQVRTLLSNLRLELDELRASWQDSAADRYLNDFAAPMEDLLQRFTDRLAQADERLGVLYADDDES